MELAGIAPEIMTEAEVVRFLRLDTVDGIDAHKTLERYRCSGVLRPTRISRKLFYSLDELRRFVRLQTDGDQLEE